MNIPQFFQDYRITAFRDCFVCYIHSDSTTTSNLCQTEQHSTVVQNQTQNIMSQLLDRIYIMRITTFQIHGFRQFISIASKHLQHLQHIRSILSIYSHIYSQQSTIWHLAKPSLPLMPLCLHARPVQAQRPTTLL